jgi:hypothetical protein
MYAALCHPNRRKERSSNFQKASVISTASETAAIIDVGRGWIVICPDSCISFVLFTPLPFLLWLPVGESAPKLIIIHLKLIARLFETVEIAV